MTARQKQKWTEAKVRALGVRTTVPIAGEIIAGLCETEARRLHHAGQFPVPVIKVGRKLVVPVQPVLELLGYGGSGDRSPVADLQRGEHGERPETAAARPALPDRAAI
jgi:hypothetical protein